MYISHLEGVYIYICIYICIYLHIYAYIYTSIHTCRYIYNMDIFIIYIHINLDKKASICLLFIYVDTYMYIHICNDLNSSCYIQVVQITTMCGEVLTWVLPGSSLHFKQVGVRGVPCPRCTQEEPLC